MFPAFACHFVTCHFDDWENSFMLSVSPLTVTHGRFQTRLFIHTCIPKYMYTHARYTNPTHLYVLQRLPPPGDLHECAIHPLISMGGKGVKLAAEGNAGPALVGPPLPSPTLIIMGQKTKVQVGSLFEAPSVLRAVHRIIWILLGPPPIASYILGVCAHLSRANFSLAPSTSELKHTQTKKAGVSCCYTNVQGLDSHLS